MSKHRSRSKGFTLLEVLIATAVTLLMMISLAKIFNIIGTSMKQGRAALELNNDLRDVALRIQSDLRNATSVSTPPADPARAEGYFKYYDGPLTDFTAALYSQSLNTDADPLNDIPDLTRFGDTDDVLMFTARADDVPYTGEVPLFVLQGVAPITDPSDPNFNLAPVTISSRYAEIVIFAEPVVTNVGNPNLEPGILLADPNAYETVVGTDMPAKYRLHYRILLIRPDLNLPATGALPFTTGGWLYATTTGLDLDSDGTAETFLPSPTCDMALPHTQCDLSLRRVTLHDPAAGITASPVAANSLEDLVDPANRFAHYQFKPTTATRTMPILALSPKIDMPFMANEPSVTGTPTGPLGCQSAFLHPAFMLYGNGRQGEDILADNLLAFDVQGFDPGVPLLAGPGADGVPGTASPQPGFPDGDDNHDGVANDAAELGWENSDDVVLDPSDAGYGTALVAGATVVGTGGYVDMGWGWKMRSQSPSATFTPAIVGSGELNGLDAPFDGDPFSDELYRSGQVWQTAAVPAPPAILQHCFDTWSSQYESDGVMQSEIASTTNRGTFEFVGTGTPPTPRDSWRSSALIDAATNGIDDNLAVGPGIDDPTEFETRPPYASDLRGVRITIRMQDPATGQFRQASISKEFVTE